MSAQPRRCGTVCPDPADRPARNSATYAHPPSQQTHPPPAAGGILGALWGWIDRNIVDLGRQMRLSYLPPLMVYLAAGIQALTGIVGTFFIKDYLDLSAQFLAALGFWAHAALGAEDAAGPSGRPDLAATRPGWCTWARA